MKIKQPFTNFRRTLVANRSEIGIRVFRASVEFEVETIAIYSQEDRFALYRFKADEAYLIGRGMGPIEAYLSIDEVIRVARENAVIAESSGKRRNRRRDAAAPAHGTRRARCRTPLRARLPAFAACAASRAHGRMALRYHGSLFFRKRATFRTIR